MNGTHAQFVALTCHGNAFLRGFATGQFFPDNSTFQFCDRVNFVELSKKLLGKPKESEVASTPDKWFEYLKRAGARGLKLASTPRNEPHISDRMSAGFVGGGEAWRVEALLAGGRTCHWRTRWEVWNQDAPERRIWRVTYGRVAESETAAAEPLDLIAIQNELRAALQDVCEFSRRKDCGWFTDCFARALAALAGKSEARSGHHHDLAPNGVLGDEAERILDACQHAWVFGGMGSWNDMGFEGEDGQVYDRVSERLFRALNQAIPLATNDSYRES